MWKATDRACGRTARWLGDYVDGMLSLARRRQVEAHLDSCAACRRELEALRRTLSLLAGLPRRGLDESFDVRLRARLEHEGAAGRRPGVGRTRPLWTLPPVLSGLRPLLPVGALAMAGVAVIAWRAEVPVEQPRPTPAYVQALVEEHQRLRVSSDLNATVVSHNLGGDELGEEE
jgi:anti-sigma factor RsiW